MQKFDVRGENADKIKFKVYSDRGSDTKPNQTLLCNGVINPNTLQIESLMISGKPVQVTEVNKNQIKLYIQAVADQMMGNAKLADSILQNTINSFNMNTMTKSIVQKF